MDERKNYRHVKFFHEHELMTDRSLFGAKKKETRESKSAPLFGGGVKIAFLGATTIQPSQ